MTDLLVTDVLVVGEGCALTPRADRPADAVGARRAIRERPVWIA
jgi:hypothetical protein